MVLNTRVKNEALERLKSEVEAYDMEAEQVSRVSMDLYQLRSESVASIIAACEKYLSDLANSPRELEKSIGELKAEFESFQSTVVELERLAQDAAIKSGVGAAGGVAAGVGVAAFAPTAAMAIATTFGTASTGTAISALSGAAATNAALAWLGGGALATGGGGMVAGKALLALAGPVGWALGGAALITAGGFAWAKNAGIAKQANEKAAEVRGQVLILKRARREIVELQGLTRKHVRGVTAQLRKLQSEAPGDYLEFSNDDKQRLGALINNVRSLSQLINRRVEIN